MKAIRRNRHGPDLLFVEPSSQVLTEEMHDVTAMALRDITYEVGPFITLLDGPMFDEWWEMRRELLLGQVAGADIVAVSRSDLLGADGFDRIQGVMEGHAKGLLRLSAVTGMGLDEIFEKINATVRMPVS